MVLLRQAVEVLKVEHHYLAGVLGQEESHLRQERPQVAAEEAVDEIELRLLRCHSYVEVPEERSCVRKGRKILNT